MRIVYSNVGTLQKNSWLIIKVSAKPSLCPSVHTPSAILSGARSVCWVFLFFFNITLLICTIHFYHEKPDIFSDQIRRATLWQKFKLTSCESMILILKSPPQDHDSGWDLEPLSAAKSWLLWLSSLFTTAVCYSGLINAVAAPVHLFSFSCIVVSMINKTQRHLNTPFHGEANQEQQKYAVSGRDPWPFTNNSVYFCIFPIN